MASGQPTFCHFCGYPPNRCECHPSAAAIRAGSGVRAAPTGAHAIPARQSIHDRRDQLANVNSLFHGGEFTCS